MSAPTVISFDKKSGEKQDLDGLVEQDPRWSQVERIVASRHFSKSGRLSTFLTYISRCTLENRGEELTEQQIGIHVFERVPGYNSSEDNIVRATARLLRLRLALYYQEDGAADSILVEVPRGGYVPHFSERDQILPLVPEPSLQMIRTQAQELERHEANRSVTEKGLSEESIDAPASNHGSPLLVTRTRWIHGWLSYAAMLCLGAVFALSVRWALSIMHEHQSPTDPLWSELFSPQETLFIPGDAGLNMYNNQMRQPHQLPLKDYIGGRYIYTNGSSGSAKTEPGETQMVGASLGSRRYVTISDLQLADHITTLERFRRDRYHVKFPRDLLAEDFRNVNAILSGGPVYNPWIDIFDTHLNFLFNYDNENGKNRCYVVNRAPLHGESATYDSNEVQGIGYGYIALTDNPNGSGKILLIEGTTHLGVDAAIVFLFNDASMAPIIDKARTGKRPLSNFEVLLETHFMSGDSTNTEIIATRFYPHS